MRLVTFGLPLLAVLAVLAGLPAAAAERDGRAQSTAVSAGQRAVLDPVTRRLRAPESAQERRRAGIGRSRRDYSQMVIEHRPDGERVVHTMGQLQMASFARIERDGTVVHECVPGSTHDGAHGHAHAERTDAE